MSWQCEVLCPGEAEGTVLRLAEPLSFWGGVDPANAKIIQVKHPQVGETIADKILVIPRLIGSSSSSAVLLELLYRARAPRALVLGAGDAILPVGCVVARQMGWTTIPVFALDRPPFQTNDHVVLAQSGRIEIV